MVDRPNLAYVVARQIGQPGQPAYLTASPNEVRCAVTGWST